MSEINYHIISSGSHGNAIVYFDEILIDVGVSYRQIKPFLDDIKIILLTHEHGDHLRRSTIENIEMSHPKIAFMGGSFITNKLESWGISNYFTLEKDITYSLKGYDIKPQHVDHNVPNFCYHVYKNDLKLFHSTDMGNLDNIMAVGYDLYGIEHNYCEIEIQKQIDIFIRDGKYPYMINSRKNHHSYQQSEEWLSFNNINDAKVLKLHISKHNGRKEDLIE